MFVIQNGWQGWRETILAKYLKDRKSRFSRKLFIQLPSKIAIILDVKNLKTKRLKQN